MWPSQTAGPQAEMTVPRAQLREKRITDRDLLPPGSKICLRWPVSPALPCFSAGRTKGEYRHPPTGNPGQVQTRRNGAGVKQRLERHKGEANTHVQKLFISMAMFHKLVYRSSHATLLMHRSHFILDDH